MHSPAGRILNSHALNPDLLASAQEKSLRPPGNSFNLSILPPVGILRISINNTRSDNIKILRINCGNKRSKVIQRIALPGSQIVLIRLIGTHGHSGKHRILLSVCLAKKHSPLVQPESHIGLKENRRSKVLTCRKIHSSILRARTDSCLNSSHITCYSIAHSTELFNIQKNRLMAGHNLFFHEFSACIHANSIFCIR